MLMRMWRVRWRVLVRRRASPGGLAKLVVLNGGGLGDVTDFKRRSVVRAAMHGYGIDI